MTYTPYFIHGADRPARWLITCDHATNVVPPFVNDGDLGLPREDMERHIAYDVGAYEVSKHLGEMLDAPVIASNFSRLVIDPNRGDDDPTLLMKLYDGTIIPANRHADAAERERRLSECYRPYHSELSKLADREDVVIISVHSFTPQLRGRPQRPWEIGILFPKDEQFSPHVVEHLKPHTDAPVGVNEPYKGYLPGDAIDTHASTHGRPNTLIELRNDLIAEQAGQIAWAEKLAVALPCALSSAGF
ncbi:N-formylglutamate amidohydrolase [Parasedimentitalea huanghaiensis]|uniref:N-formylglutamate amidohydrolase n=1 Tax=Parasedimentitalea huanghaiensis TaxID=2682100 RepID=A0A6L6WGS8_9RHOB|nr:N-formylglutamate amidohydrolase [Zongyanglinia huanghaiensis]MVO15257.1 N-formylglutamate amidohydrolase [Zongyanglinia huanghaiensis]